jgi:hypothetical protein
MRKIILIVILASTFACSKNQNFATCRKSERGDFYLESGSSYLLFSISSANLKQFSPGQKGVVSLDEITISEDQTNAIIAGDGLVSTWIVTKNSSCMRELRAQIKDKTVKR